MAPAFTTAFVKPTTLTGLVATGDATTSHVSLSWTASTLALDIFDRYIVERQAGETPWGPIDEGTLSNRDAPAFTDESAPAGATVRYRVRVSIGATGFDSDALEGELVTLEQWAVVVPGNGALTRGQLPIRISVGERRPRGVTRRMPLGVRYPLYSEDVRPGASPPAQLELAMVITPEHDDLAELVWDWEATRPWVLLKGKRGRIWRARFEDMYVREIGYELREATWQAIEVA